MKKKVILFSDSPFYKSGMGIVINHLAQQFARDYDVSILGWHHVFHPIETQKNYPLPLYPIKKESLYPQGYKEEPEQVGQAISSILKGIEEEAYLITLGDIYDFRYMSVLKDLIHVKGYNFRWIHHLNIDSSRISNKFMSTFMHTNKIVCTSKWGMNQLKQFDPSLDVDYCYHGIDLQKYHPINLEEKEKVVNHPQLKYDLYLGDKFVVLVDGQNTARKDIPRAIDIFTKFSANRDDCVMMLITDPLSENGNGHNLLELMSEEDIDAQKIMFLCNNITRMQNYQDEHMNYFYNLATVLLNCSKGEGFGLPYLQAFATNTIPLATDFSANTELLSEGRGEIVKVKDYENVVFNGKMATMDEEDAINKLEKLYNLWATSSLKSYYIAGQQFVKEHTWEHVYEYFKDVIENNKYRKVHSFSRNSPQVPVNTELRRLFTKHLGTCKAKNKIGMVVMGGIGDNLQATPIIKAISKKYEDCCIYIVCEGNPEVFFKHNNATEGFIHSNIFVATAPGKSFVEIVKSVHDLFDVFYDIRYVSYCFDNAGKNPVPEESVNFFRKNAMYYNGWPWQNNRIYMLNKHVADIRLQSSGLQGYASIKDMAMDMSPVKLPEGKYVVLNNGAGNVGTLKIIDNSVLEDVVKYLKECGYKCVQVGRGNETFINGCIDLRDMTNLWETNYVLKHAEFSICPEGTIYHMSHAQGLRSIVYLSVTHPECFVYEDSIVLPSKNTKDYKCNPCWWTSEYWSNKCALGYEKCINFPNAGEIVEGSKKIC